MADMIRLTCRSIVGVAVLLACGTATAETGSFAPANAAGLKLDFDVDFKPRIPRAFTADVSGRHGGKVASETLATREALAGIARKLNAAPTTTAGVARVAGTPQTRFGPASGLSRTLKDELWIDEGSAILRYDDIDRRLDWATPDARPGGGFDLGGFNFRVDVGSCPSQRLNGR